MMIAFKTPEGLFIALRMLLTDNAHTIVQPPCRAGSSRRVKQGCMNFSPLSIAFQYRASNPLALGLRDIGLGKFPGTEWLPALMSLAPTGMSEQAGLFPDDSQATVLFIRNQLSFMRNKRNV
jgi:hypothetical protein